ncbi:SDR family oxidoreductase [Flavihumibacter solisilvae]|uniref:Short-chain dehydrogenase n=1 Tax=Flavihumibacter solisilvae TaxID=1349421 RepID=A0A0C1L0T4_9BACT|nr:SDR family oxidoreductase [Flavihumibacter solisilvae]KIC93206.1 hypothetical protein OI18_18295 [Flavihumibacter solisilvae]
MSKVILVTGASGGLGKSIAEQLTEDGHIVYGAARSQASSQVSYHQVVMDVTSESDIRKAVETIVREHGRIDVLVNNAGLGIAGPLEVLARADTEAVINTNILGVLLTCQAVLPHMRRQKAGVIINISSIGSEMGLPYRSVYSASKAAVDRLTESLRMEMKPFGIRACIVQPGDINTNINRNRLTSELADSEAYGKSFARTNRLMNDGVRKGMDPVKAARLISSIISSNRVKKLYRMGTFSERLSVVLKKILPAPMFEKLISNHYQV